MLPVGRLQGSEIPNKLMVCLASFFCLWIRWMTLSLNWANFVTGTRGSILHWVFRQGQFCFCLMGFVSEWSHGCIMAAISLPFNSHCKEIAALFFIPYVILFENIAVICRPETIEKKKKNWNNFNLPNLLIATSGSHGFRLLVYSISSFLYLNI